MKILNSRNNAAVFFRCRWVVGSANPNRCIVGTTKSTSKTFWPSVNIARGLHTSRRLCIVKPFLLADIGEGIREVQIIQWFVQPGARVEQFDKLCEVSSDKATVEITSRFDGVIKKLHYEADDMAKVGKPLVDIDIQSQISPEDEALTRTSEKDDPGQHGADVDNNIAGIKESSTSEARQPPAHPEEHTSQFHQPSRTAGKHASLATPAVRHAAKELDVDITDIDGSGKDGRVLKEDVHRFATSRRADVTKNQGHKPSPTPPTVLAAEDRTVSLTPNQIGMFKAMTASLLIPHFLYTSTIDLTALTALRQSLNTHPSPPSGTSNPADPPQTSPQIKLSLLPFLLKAVSVALTAHPLLNARLDTTTHGPSKPLFQYRSAHNLGVAVDTEHGLLVPVLRSAQSHSILSLAAEVQRLAQLGRAGKLQPGDMQGGTLTISNIGSVGAGGVVAPVIVEGQTAIIGVGRSRVVPAFNDMGELVKREECVLSWSADHRIVDGGTVARCAEYVRTLLEKPERLLVRLT